MKKFGAPASSPAGRAASRRPPAPAPRRRRASRRDAGAPLRLRPATLFFLAFCLLPSALCLGQTVAATPRGIVVAHDGRVELFNANGRDVVWSTDGVAAPSKIVAGGDRVAVLDALNSAVRIVELASGRGTTARCGETPLDGVFAGRALYLLERDARALERIGGDGAGASIDIAADPAFLHLAGDRLYVYARAAGLLQEVTTAPFAVRRSVAVAPFASDVQGDAKRLYLVYPRDAKVRVVDLAAMKPAGDIAVGAVPAAIGFASGSGALTARTLAVADPSAKRVWMIEGTQSFSQAFARGFLRGLIGLGLGGSRDAQFPTGVDRVVLRGGLWLAYDGSSRTLYRFTKKNSSVLAKDVSPQAFTATSDAAYVWDETVRRLHRYPRQ